MVEGQEVEAFVEAHPLRSEPSGEAIVRLVAEFGFEPGDAWIDGTANCLSNGDRNVVSSWSEKEVERRIAAGNADLPATEAERRYEMLRLMSDLSEDTWCATWLTDLELVVWRMLEGHGAERAPAETLEKIGRLLDVLEVYPLPSRDDRRLVGEWVTLDVARTHFGLPPMPGGHHA